MKTELICYERVMYNRTTRGHTYT